MGEINFNGSVKRLKQINYIFYSVLFLGFFLPSNSSFHISLAGIEFEIREIAFLLLPIINLLCRSKNRIKAADKKLQYLILLFITIVAVTEVLKHLYFGGGFGAAFKTIRIGLPLFSCLTILFFGIRANIEKVWRTLLWAIAVSAVLTLITPFVYLPIYPVIEGENIIEATAGRFINSNASFGIIGIYLLYRDQDRWYNKSWLATVTAILGIIILILSFNRTYLALLALAFVYLSFSDFSFRKALKYVSIPFIALVVFWGTYTYSDMIQRQIDKRIIYALTSDSQVFLDAVYYGSRDDIYSQINNRYKEGKWIIGTSYNNPIFEKTTHVGYYQAKKTDISLVNINLRYGLIPLLIYIYFYTKLYIKGNSFYRFVSITILISSLNIDSLLNHNSVFFLFIVFFITNFRYENSSFNHDTSRASY